MTHLLILQFAYFKRILEREKKRRHADDNSDGEENDASDAASDADDQMDQDATESQPSQKKKSAVKPKEPKRPKSDVPSDSEDAATGSDVTVSKEQLSKFQSSLFAIFEEKHVQQIPIDEVRKHVMAKTKLNEAEIMSCIEQMSSDNKIMLASDILYLI